MAKKIIRNNIKLLIIPAFLILTLAAMVVSINHKSNLKSKAANPYWNIGEVPVDLPKPVNIILDSDMASDIDDPKAVAELNQLVRRGEINLLAVVSNTSNIYSASALQAMNSWYGNGNIPIGAYKLDANYRKSPFNEYVSKTYGRGLTRDKYPDALTVYRQALSSAPDNSVVILSLGF